jgi:hypothetical protein
MTTGIGFGRVSHQKMLPTSRAMSSMGKTRRMAGFMAGWNPLKSNTRQVDAQPE